MGFSKRQGLEPDAKPLQMTDIDSELRSSLWNCVQVAYWDNHQRSTASRSVRRSNLGTLFTALWTSFFKRPLDTMPSNFVDAKRVLRDYFFECPWNRVYDFIEFAAARGPEKYSQTFRNICNVMLGRENSAFRFVGGRVTQMTDETEIGAIEEALATTAGVSGVRQHLVQALKLMADRDSPDYRNSMKESISAVEAMCRLLTGDQNASLGDALALLERGGTIHGALKSAYGSLYGYTSDADGIRHALLRETELTLVDAKFMLVACAGFVNYLLGKAGEKGLGISQGPN